MNNLKEVSSRKNHGFPFGESFVALGHSHLGLRTFPYSFVNEYAGENKTQLRLGEPRLTPCRTFIVDLLSGFLI